ncbi:MAG: hypothetical protein RIQ89_851 [Bacteroidota bacterium]|jgi:UDP-N-acetylmuramate--alanine ligase
MNPLKQITHLYFLGIGGIGMSALARYFNLMGCKVSGYDKTQTNLTLELEAEGIKVHYEDDESVVDRLAAVKSETLVVRTPAVPLNLKIYKKLNDQNFNIVKRSILLGWITKQRLTIAVAGTHGKTTTSSMVAHVLTHCNDTCIAFLGGIANNYKSNLLLPLHTSADHPIVVEADEYDKSFLTLYPHIAVITSMDPDHLDIYGDEKSMHQTYQQFAQQVNEEGTLLLHHQLSLAPVKANVVTYGLLSTAQCHATNIHVHEGAFCFDYVGVNEQYSGFKLFLPGRHNIENAIAAIAIARIRNLPFDQIQMALQNYKGVKRRFELVLHNKINTIIDDYAHHPTELTAAITAAKELFPQKKITGIFQPHLYSRTRDFVDGFAESLSMLDEVWLMDIYPAREMPIEGVTSKIIYDKITVTNKHMCTKESIIHQIKERKVEILLILGAGDIDTLVVPIAQHFSQA